MQQAEDLTTLKDELSGLAQQVATEAFGITLDYSIESVRQVDRILGALHDEYLQTNDDSGLSGLALEFGAYLIKVIETHFIAGIWKRDHAQFGEGTFPYEWRGGELFPVSWCEKRLFDGPQDDIWAKFDTFVLHDPRSQ